MCIKENSFSCILRKCSCREERRNLNFPAIKYCGICLTFSVCCFVHGGCCLKFVQTVFGYLVFCICCLVVCCFEFNVLCFGVGCFLVLHIVLILNKSTYSYGCPKNSLLSSIMCMWLPLNTTTQEKKKIKRFKTSILQTRP